MIFTSADDAIAHTVLTQVEIAIIACTAMIVCIWNGVVALVAVDRVDADGWVYCSGAGALPESGLIFSGQTRVVCKPLAMCNWSSSGGRLNLLSVGW